MENYSVKNFLVKNCSFTGHRKISEAYTAPLEELLVRAIEYTYSEGCRNFFCGGALGFDTMAAKAVISMRIKYPDIKLFLCLPCKNQSEGWPSSDIDMYNFILASANEVIYTSEEYSKDCMRIRNRELASLCDVMIAFCGRSNSGSGQTIKMASDMGKTVYNLYRRVVNSSDNSGFFVD